MCLRRLHLCCCCCAEQKAEHNTNGEIKWIRKTRKRIFFLCSSFEHFSLSQFTHILCNRMSGANFVPPQPNVNIWIWAKVGFSWGWCSVCFIFFSIFFFLFGRRKSLILEVYMANIIGHSIKHEKFRRCCRRRDNHPMRMMSVVPRRISASDIFPERDFLVVLLHFHSTLLHFALNNIPCHSRPKNI